MNLPRRRRFPFRPFPTVILFSGPVLGERDLVRELFDRLADGG